MVVPRFHPGGRFEPTSLFRPESIGIVGVDTHVGAAMASRLAMSGFRGAVRSVRSNQTLPDRVDLAVLAVPQARIGTAMDALGASGCRAVIVPGAADELAAHAARTGVRALGAHSFGLCVPEHLDLSLTHLAPPRGRLALIGQSAGLARAVIDWAEPNGVGFSHIVGIGTNADVGFGLVLDWLSRDPDTGAILLEIRRIKDRRRFLSAARAAARLRPVVALHAGLRSGDPASTPRCDRTLAFEAALRRAGVLSVDTLEDLLAAAETLSRAKPIRSDRLAIVANAVGGARLAADAVLRNGLRLADQDETTDVVTADLASAAIGLGARADVGAVLAVHTPSGGETVEALVQASRQMPMPLLVCAMGETTGAPYRFALGRSGLPVFATPAQAVAGFDYLVRDQRNRAAARELPPRAVLSLAPDRRLVARLFRRVRDAGRLALAPDEAMAVLEAYGVPMAPTRVAATAEEVGAAAALLGFPAVVKLRSFQPPERRTAQRVVFDARDPQRAELAGRDLLLQATQDDRGLLVQRQVGRARELAIRVADDAVFGPVITVRAGGTLADPADRSADLPPLNLPLAQALIRRCASGAALDLALRDRAPAAAEEVARVLVRISQLVLDFPEMAVLDVASLFVDADGVLVADAWIRLRGTDAAAAVLAITPYPAELVTHGTFKGERVTMRPIRPEDAEAHAAFFLRLSPEDVRFRFFNAMREMSKQQTVRLTHVDYDREIAFVAVRDATGETVGVSRLACEPHEDTGEFAVIVQPDMKGRGVASCLMRCVIDWARARALTEVIGQVLADNAPMLAFVRHLGFSVHHMLDDPGVMEVRLRL